MSISSWAGCVSAGTQHRRQREVKAFFSWCRRMDYVEENPFMLVPMVRREQKVVQPFTKEDVTLLARPRWGRTRRWAAPNPKWSRFGVLWKNLEPNS